MKNYCYSHCHKCTAVLLSQVFISTWHHCLVLISCTVLPCSLHFLYTLCSYSFWYHFLFVLVRRGRLEYKYTATVQHTSLTWRLHHRVRRKRENPHHTPHSVNNAVALWTITFLFPQLPSHPLHAPFKHATQHFVWMCVPVCVKRELTEHSHIHSVKPMRAAL